MRCCQIRTHFRSNLSPIPLDKAYIGFQVDSKPCLSLVKTATSASKFCLSCVNVDTLASQPYLSFVKVATLPSKFCLSCVNVEALPLASQPCLFVRAATLLSKLWLSFVRAATLPSKLWLSFVRASTLPVRATTLPSKKYRQDPRFNSYRRNVQ